MDYLIDRADIHPPTHPLTVKRVDVTREMWSKRKRMDGVAHIADDGDMMSI